MGSGVISGKNYIKICVLRQSQSVFHHMPVTCVLEKPVISETCVLEKTLCFRENR